MAQAAWLAFSCVAAGCDSCCPCAGFDGHFTKKAGANQEGCATFWRRSRFRLHACQDVSLRDCFRASMPQHLLLQRARSLHSEQLPPPQPVRRQQRGSPTRAAAPGQSPVPGPVQAGAARAGPQQTPAEAAGQGPLVTGGAQAAAERHARFCPLLEASSALAHSVQKVSSIAQVCVLVPSTADSPPGSSQEAASSATSDRGAGSDEPLCVVNTHLFYHPRAPHIRNMQMAAILAEAEAVMQAPAAAGPGRPALLLCGDLNSGLNQGIPGQAALRQHCRLRLDSHVVHPAAPADDVLPALRVPAGTLCCAHGIPCRSRQLTLLGEITSALCCWQALCSCWTRASSQQTSGTGPWGLTLTLGHGSGGARLVVQRSRQPSRQWLPATQRRGMQRSLEVELHCAYPSAEGCIRCQGSGHFWYAGRVGG